LPTNSQKLEGQREDFPLEGAVPQGQFEKGDRELAEWLKW
jgi:hypothetical protein